MDISYALDDKYPDRDVQRLTFAQLSNMAASLEQFSDDPKKCNEKILEAIQAAWLSLKSE